MMKKIDAPGLADVTSTQHSSIRVCMHVMAVAQNDVRAMRSASALVEGGFSVSLVGFQSENTQPTRGDSDGIDMQYIPVSRSFIATRFKRRVLIRSVWMLIRSTFRLLRTPADIYHALDLPALPASYLAAKLRRKPLIFESYELPLYTQPTSEMSPGRRFLHVVLGPLLAHMLPRCTAVIAVSPPIVLAMRSRYHLPRVALVRNVPPYRVIPKSDRLRQYLGLDSRVRIALYQGNIQPDRSLEILVRAAPFLEANIIIVLMGNNVGTTAADLEALIAQLGVAAKVKFIPAVSYTELLYWTVSADIGLIICSPDYSPNIAMLLPNKLFEYLMVGLPVLTSRLEAVADVIRTYDVGQVVSSLAPADVGAAINNMLANDAVLARMSCNALNAAQNELCWERERDQLISLYHDILDEHRDIGRVLYEPVVE